MAYSKSYPIPENMLNTINGCTAGLGAAGIVGGVVGPGADTIVIIPVWVGMVIALVGQAGASMDNQTAKKLCMAVLTGVGTFALGTKAASTFAAWLFALPTAGLSLVANAGVNGALNATLTRAFGRAVSRYFLQTHEIENWEVAALIIAALIGTEFGIPTSRSDIIA
jgi:uncharacterized protein (DUF697 family)